MHQQTFANKYTNKVSKLYNMEQYQHLSPFYAVRVVGYLQAVMDFEVIDIFNQPISLLSDEKSWMFYIVQSLGKGRFW